ncbi:cyclase family protein [Halopenitus salinus]|uniref:Cyclase family protein n=1 Tax=Halopenitus salinus TaxID=1198295 RepID=A0ABD5UPV4_9EURY
MTDSVEEAVATLTDAEWVDLTHTLEEDIPAVPTHARFGHTLYESYEWGDEACHYRITMGEHSGTHIDAPLHFIAEGDAHYDVASIPLECLVGRAATIDATDVEGGKTVTRERIETWEQEHGSLRNGDRVLFWFGWDRYWDTGETGQEYLDSWPGLSAKAAAYLTDIGIDLVGCDTAAVDASGNDEFPAHYELLGEETYIVENLTNLDQLPAFSALFTFPLKIDSGSGSPIRAVAMID